MTLPVVEWVCGRLPISRKRIKAEKTSGSFGSLPTTLVGCGHRPTLLQELGRASRLVSLSDSLVKNSLRGVVRTAVALDTPSF